MAVRTNGGVFNEQMLTGSLRHFVLEGADFSGAMNMFGQPVPFSAAEIIFTNISRFGYINIMNPNEYNISFALEINRSDWDGPKLTEMVRSLGPDVGVDHIDCSVCTVTEVPYIWDLGGGPGATSFLQLNDTPSTYAGSAGYAVTVSPGATGLIFTPIPVVSSFAHVASPSQPTIDSGTNDTLTVIGGTNIVVTTNASAKSVTISSTAGTDYIPVPPGTTLSYSTRYFVTASGIVTLPPATGSGKPAGTSIIIAKPTNSIIFVNVNSLADIIATDLGNTDSVEFDATQEIILVFDGSSSWNLQIGSVNL
jgi:hypothetical protein